MFCPDPPKCVRGPAPHEWDTDCELASEGWSLDVPSSSAHVHDHRDDLVTGGRRVADRQQLPNP